MEKEIKLIEHKINEIELGLELQNLDKYIEDYVTKEYLSRAKQELDIDYTTILYLKERYHRLCMLWYQEKIKQQKSI